LFFSSRIERARIQQQTQFAGSRENVYFVVLVESKSTPNIRGAVIAMLTFD